MSASFQAKEYELIKVNISDLRFDNDNPNKLTQEQMHGLAESFKKFGYLSPIIIDQNNLVADGEHRALVYKQFNMETIPAYKITLSSDIERRMLRQTMNKLHGEHDKQLDSAELLEIFQADRLTELSDLIAQEQYGLQGTIRQFHPDVFFEKPEDFDSSKELDDIIPTTKLGDLYQLGRHRLICADCSDTRSLDKLLEGDKPTLLLTDPPYGISIVKFDKATIGGSKPITIKGHVAGSNIVEANNYRAIEGDNEAFDPTHLLRLASAKHHIIFGANYFADKLPISSGWIIWYKRREQWDRTTFAECELAWSDFDIPARMYGVLWMGIIKEGEHDKRLHPTQKPVKLINELVHDFTNENDTIIDPYAGSGSTIIAAEQSNRTCYAVEIDPLYCDVMINRWEKYAGQKATVLS